MTTEVLRNMIYAASPALDGLRYVVLDEVHYLQNRYRGAGVGGGHHPPRRPTVTSCASRRRCRTPRSSPTGSRRSAGAPRRSSRSDRPVELEHLLPGRRAGHRAHSTCCRRSSPGPTASSGPTPRPPASTPATRATRGWRGRPRSRLRTPRRVELVELLAARGDAARDRRSSSAAPAATRRSSSASPPGSASPTPDERARIRAIADAQDRRPRRRRPRRARLRRAGWPGSRRASPPTTPGWSRR